MAQGRALYSEDAIKRRLMKGNPGQGAPAQTRGNTTTQLSPSNGESAGSMLKTNIKPKGGNASALKKLGKGWR